jgi:putative tricarboxylic transport membrane protein
VIDGKSLRGIGLKLSDIAAQGYNIARSFVIGLIIGFLPGMGAGLSNIVAYSSAKNASKTPEKFGTGFDDGVWASETSNNAAVGGALIPTTSLGIPGDTATALLIGAMTIHGLELGPMSFKNSGDVIYLMYMTVIMSALFVLVLQMFGKQVFPYILRVPNHYMHPMLLVISLVSAYVSTNNMANIWLMIFFAVIGIIMVLGDLPTSPLLLAFILGPTIEKNMLKAFQYSGTYAAFFTRPLSAIFLGITVLSIFAPLLRAGYGKLAGAHKKA